MRTVCAEYLIAMKLMAGRKYKNDLSDVVGILMEHEKAGAPIGMERIDVAMHDLYDGWKDVPEDLRAFIEAVVQNGDYEALYRQYRAEEEAGRTALLDFEKNYPGVMKEGNINDILKAARAKKERERDSR